MVKCIYLILFMLTSLAMNAQEETASISNIDIKNLSIYKANLVKTMEETEIIAPLYTEWKNSGVRASGKLPETFDVDLRDFSMPTTHRIVTSQYGKRWGRMHKGIDVKVYEGDTIYSAFDGKVRVVKYEAKGYGYYIVIRHKNGLETLYAHLSKQLVHANDTVKSGQPIGIGGNTGRSTGSHLHFETSLCGIPINPSLLFDFKLQTITDDFYRYKR
jgi:murein DD-endopeptidase MepM/ murein hydrolase activator NlpD